MIRTILTAITLLATPAAAQTERAVIGTNRPVANSATEQKNLAALQAALDAAEVKAQESINAGVASIKNVGAAKKALETLFPAGGSPRPIVTAPAAALAQPRPSVINPAPVPAPAPIAEQAATLASFAYGKPANGVAWFGASLGDGKHSGSGWPKVADMRSMVNLGVKTVRLPIDPKYCLNADGTINEWVVKTLATAIKFNITRGVSTVLDAHTYLLFTDPAVATFWARFAPAMEKAIDGPTPLFGIELANEPGKGNKDLTVWTEPLRKTIRAIRTAGYQGYIFAGAGDWNNMTFLQLALTEVERTGGVKAMDPYNRTIYTGHDYWNKDGNPGKTRNDQGAAVDGTIVIANRYGPTLAVARRIGAKVVMSEIGGGIAPNGPLPAYNGVGKDGAALTADYFAFAKANEDVLIGSWFWMTGKVKADYRHKVEAGNPHTKALQKFW
jgi:hypothetical protein